MKKSGVAELSLLQVNSWEKESILNLLLPAIE